MQQLNFDPKQIRPTAAAAHLREKSEILYFVVFFFFLLKEIYSPSPNYNNTVSRTELKEATAAARERIEEKEIITK